MPRSFIAFIRFGDAKDAHDSLEVVSEHVQAHLGAHIRERARQEVRGSHRAMARATYDMQVDGARMSARARLRTDAQGRYWFWSIRPFYYPIPMGWAGGADDHLLWLAPESTGAHPLQAVGAATRRSDHASVRCQQTYIESDVVFGVRDSLVVEFERHEPGKAADGRVMTTTFWSAHYDFRLIPAGR